MAAAAEEPDPALLEVTQLEIVYNRVATAVQGVSFRVPQGSIVALLGTNGAGKTTILRGISGFIDADNAGITNGTIAYQGRDITGFDPASTARSGLVLVPERRKIFETLSVEDNLALSVGRLDSAAADLLHSCFPVLSQKRRQLAGYLSGGERQVLAIGCALACEPRLLLVDELSLGLASAVAAELFATLARLNRELGLTILLVEQNARAALEIAESGYVLESGRIVYAGDSGRLRENEEIREFYLGMGGHQARNYRDVKQYRRTRRWWN